MTSRARTPGRVVSVLTPTSRYAEPFFLRLASEPGAPRDLCIVHGPGSFGRQVADGTEVIARRAGVRILSLRSLAVLAGFSELNPQIARDVRQTALAGRLSCMTGTLKTLALSSAADGAAWAVLGPCGNRR
jgi:hypothetical protein